MSIGKNLSKLMVSKNLTLQDVATALNVSRQAVSRWKTDNSDPEASKLVDLAKFLGVPITDLFEDGFRIATCVPEEEDCVPEGIVEIPEYRFRLAAGTGNFADWEEIHESRKRWYCADFFSSRGIKPERCVRCQVKGDSMEPFIYNGDVIMFCIENNITLNDIEDGEIYAFIFEEGLRIKRLSTQTNSLIIRSDNPEYPTERLQGPDLDKIKIYGKVIEICRSL